MGRPTGSKANRNLTVLFGDCVTRATTQPRDVIPRCGPLSIFSALAQCCSTAVRIDDAGPRDGISELEANKLLEKNGFKRVRDRRAVAKNKNEDPTGAGLYLFAGRQWRDATDPGELSYMLEAWKGMCTMHPAFARECPFDMLIDVIRTCEENWRPKGTSWKRKRTRPSEKFSQGSTNDAEGDADAQNNAKRQRLDDASSDEEGASPAPSEDTGSDDEPESPSPKRPAFAEALMQQLSPKATDGKTAMGVPASAFTPHHGSASFQAPSARHASAKPVPEEASTSDAKTHAPVKSEHADGDTGNRECAPPNLAVGPLAQPALWPSQGHVDAGALLASAQLHQLLAASAAAQLATSQASFLVPVPPLAGVPDFTGGAVPLNLSPLLSAPALAPAKPLAPLPPGGLYTTSGLLDPSVLCQPGPVMQHVDPALLQRMQAAMAPAPQPLAAPHLPIISPISRHGTALVQ